MAKKAPALKRGRPTKYKPEYCQKIIEYFNVPHYRETFEEKMSASGAVETLTVIKPTDLPTFDGFAFDICKTHIDTLHEWRKVHPDFSESYRTAKGLQKRLVQTHAINGGYSAQFSKFFAVNCLGMKDKTESTNENNTNVSYGLAFDLSKDPKQIEEENK